MRRFTRWKCSWIGRRLTAGFGDQSSWIMTLPVRLSWWCAAPMPVRMLQQRLYRSLKRITVRRLRQLGRDPVPDNG